MEKIPKSSALYKQITDSALRVEVQHVAHLIKMDRMGMYIKMVTIGKIFLTGITVSGVLKNLFGSSSLVIGLTFIAAAASFILVLAEYNFRFEENRSVLKQQGQHLWRILEKFNNLIADINDNKIEDNNAREIRDSLVKELDEVYSKSTKVDKKSIDLAKERLSKKRMKDEVTS